MIDGCGLRTRELHQARDDLLLSHPGVQKKELAGNPVSAAIVTWYLLENSGDDIAFISDSDDDWPFSAGARTDLGSYTEITDRVVEHLVSEGIWRIAASRGSILTTPTRSYTRDLRSIWMGNSAD